MRTDTAVAPKTYRFPAIVEPLGPGTEPESMRVRLIHDRGSLEALTWAYVPNAPCVPPSAAHVTVMEHPHVAERYLLVASAYDPNLSPAALLHDSLCPISGVVAQTKALIQSITSVPLRTTVLGALAQPDAVTGYWKAPASLQDHHAYDGGLAHHSLEVATMVASSTGLSAEDRDLSIAFALLHDYGKIWCYCDGQYTAAQRRGHVRVGLEKLEPLLAYLRRGDGRLADTMEELLGGRSQRADRRYPLAIGRVVNAFDQLSCEKTRRSQERGDFDF
jgi:hypothetical protein